MKRPAMFRVERCWPALALALVLLLGCVLPEVSAAQVPADFAEEPGLQRVGASDGDPPAAILYGTNDIVGYALLTSDIAPIPAYSGKPIDALVGFDTAGKVRGVRIVAHEEPILVVGISEDDLVEYVGQYVGLRVADEVRIGGQPAPGRQVIDGISGATITAMVLNRSISESLRKVALARGLLVDDGESRRFDPPNRYGSCCGPSGSGRSLPWALACCPCC
jgi:transcriptional regulator of nitric oxide reductase